LLANFGGKYQLACGSKRGSTDLLQRIWESAKEKLNIDKLLIIIFCQKMSEEQEPGKWPQRGATLGYGKNIEIF